MPQVPNSNGGMTGTKSVNQNEDRPFITITHSEGTGIIPGKHSDTRIKPLPLANGHGRYITVTPERALVSVGECPLHIAVKF